MSGALPHQPKEFLIQNVPNARVPSIEEGADDHLMLIEVSVTKTLTGCGGTSKPVTL